MHTTRGTRVALLVLAASVLAAAAACTRPEAARVVSASATHDGSRAARSGWTLVWQDEFDGARGAPVDPRKWRHEVGGRGWGNAELEYYTARAENASLDGEGHLAIRALRETYTGAEGVTRSFTSGRLKTQGLFEQAYGRFEASIKLPRGQGIWPAFWMLGGDISRVGWPGCGEIDIMEQIGREPAIVHGTIHGPGYSGSHGIGAPNTLPSGAAFADHFHLFAVEWRPHSIRWEVDGHVYETRTPADLPAGQHWVYDHPFFLILNLAVGGRWPGDPNETTTFPQTMLVDYVRVYKPTNAEPASW
jgi:beta-glucanase (GH16 family)